MEYPPFPGFRPEALAFLQDLKTHNDRDWFKANKSVYDDELVWPTKCLLVDVAARTQALGYPLIGDPKKGMFRIYRDVRFSKNKDPYKTHVGAVLSRSGTRKEAGGFYIHIEPGNVFLASGFWQPDNKLLRSWRERMTDDPDGFLAQAKGLTDADMRFSTREGDALKRMPRGFEQHADSPVADYLRWKSFVAVKELNDNEVLDSGFVTLVAEMIRDVYPFLQYGWEVEDHTKSG